MGCHSGGFASIILDSGLLARFGSYTGSTASLWTSSQPSSHQGKQQVRNLFTHTAKWPEVHTAFAKQNGLKYPVSDTAYNRLAPSALRAVWPHIAALPAREFDIVTMFDKLYCVPSGSGRNKSGQKLYINLSQAPNRDPVTFGHLSCIIPGGKYIDLEAGEIMHGAVLMKLQCITDSYDITFQFWGLP